MLILEHHIWNKIFKTSLISVYFTSNKFIIYNRHYCRENHGNTCIKNTLDYGPNTESKISIFIGCLNRHCKSLRSHGDL